MKKVSLACIAKKKDDTDNKYPVYPDEGAKAAEPAARVFEREAGTTPAPPVFGGGGVVSTFNVSEGESEAPGFYIVSELNWNHCLNWPGTRAWCPWAKVSGAEAPQFRALATGFGGWRSGEEDRGERRR